ncbi:hypothetical protein FZI91_20205 [Mycobacterium sp. CBMA271]|nr:hypothetical protein [Mycobacteroides sp. CBMA 271]
MSNRFEKTSAPAPEGQSTAVRVLDATGAVRQTIVEPYKGLGSAPIVLRDLDQDGREELLVALDSRQRYVRWAIWRAQQPSPTYSRVGEVVGEAYSAEPNVVMVRAGSDISFLDFDAGALRPIAEAAINGDGHCSLAAHSGISRLGLQPADAEKRLCEVALR